MGRKKVTIRMNGEPIASVYASDTMMDDDSEGWKKLRLVEIKAEIDGVPVEFRRGDIVEKGGRRFECLDPAKSEFIEVLYAIHQVYCGNE